MMTNHTLASPRSALSESTAVQFPFHSLLHGSSRAATAMTSQGPSCTLRLLRLLGRSANMSFEIQFVHRLSQLASNTVKLTYVGSYFSVPLDLSRSCLSESHNGKLSILLEL